MGQLTKDEVFALAVQRYSDTVFRAAMHNCSCAADAEDVVQDVFEKLLCYNGRFESEEHLKAWLLRVTVNCCRDLWRSAWLKRVVLGAPTLDIIPAQEETLEQREEKAELMRAIHKLPRQFRETILLHYYQGLGISEIAQTLGLPEGTISSRLSRARKKLESLLKEEATGD